MLRTLVIAIEIGILLLLLRSSYVQYFFNDAQLGLSDWMTELSLAAEREELSGLRDAISPFTSPMRDYQQEYLSEVTSSKARLSHFYEHYCVGSDKNPYVYGNTLRSICSAIRSTDLT